MCWNETSGACSPKQMMASSKQTHRCPCWIHKQVRLGKLSTCSGPFSTGGHQSHSQRDLVSPAATSWAKNGEAMASTWGILATEWGGTNSHGSVWNGKTGVHQTQLSLNFAKSILPCFFGYMPSDIPTRLVDSYVWTCNRANRLI